mgnify:CR=1 FL=1
MQRFGEASIERRRRAQRTRGPGGLRVGIRAIGVIGQREIGDVLLAWENEAFLAQGEFGQDKFEIVAPPLSILAEPPISVVDKVADKNGTRPVAEAYLKYWYTKEGQEIAARNSYRPRDSEIAKEYEKSFAKVELFTIDNVFGGWTKAQKDHFAEGGIFDQIYKN